MSVTATRDPLMPVIGVVTDIRIDTPDVKTFRVVTPDGKKAFEHRPGQCAMLSVPGVGEAMFSITSSPTNTEFMEFSIKKCGCVTEWLHSMEPGQQITIRGPYGNGFPVDDVFAGRDLLFIAGGIGLAPLRSVINYCRRYRDRYGKIDIVYGSRSMQDLVDYNEIIDEWAVDAGVSVHLTIDKEQPEWSGTPTELLERLPGVSIQANILTRKLNVSADRLYNDYGIRYESRRTHEGRVVKLTLENSGA